MATQAVYYRSAGGSEPVAEFLDQEFPLEPRKKKPGARELQAAATKRITIDLQIDRLNGLANEDPPLPFPHTSQIDGPLRELRCHYGRRRGRRTVIPSDGLSSFAKVPLRLSTTSDGNGS